MRSSKFLAAVAALTIGLASASAFAADVSTPARAYYPSHSTPAYDWSGAYFGAQAGFVSGTSNVDGVIAGFGTFATGSAHGTGAIGGLIGGYHWQSGPLVYGIEGDLNVGGPHGSTNLVGVDGTFKSKWDMSLRPTLGYAVSSDLLVYVTGGLEMAKFGFNANGLGINESWSSTKAAWTAGVGFDYRINRNLFAGLQYRYSDFGTMSHDLVSVPGVSINNKATSNAVLLRVGALF